MHIGVLRVHFRIFAARSLKEKRQIVQSLKGRLQSRFNVSVAEIGSQHLWNAGEIGVAMIGSDRRYVNGALEKIRSFFTANPAISVIEDDLEML
jgi:hypothetical protein